MELSNFIVEAVLKAAVTDKIVVYGGRFQPFHKGHKKVYDSLVAKFGSKNVYIATSDVQDGDKSPLSFNEKKEIATKLFSIPSSKFVKVKQPYQPVEILRGYDDATTALIVAVGEKDDARLGGNYFKPYTNDKNLKGYAVNAYVYTQLPSNSFGATDVRNMFRNKRMGDKRKEAEFTKFFGKFDKTIYNKLDKKLNEDVDTDNNIPGGKADNLTLVDIAKKYAGDYYDYRNVLEIVKKQLKNGIKIELEHTSDVKLAAEIAKDHISEDLHYYEKLDKIENPKEIKEENPLYQPDEIDLENILDFEMSDPSNGTKYTIRQALKLPKTTFARQEAMRLLRLLVAKNHVSGAGHLSKTLFPPNEDEPKNKLNLSLGIAYGENVDLDEASAAGSGYDEKTLDQLVDNPETGEKVKVRSALNYDKNHPAYRAAMMLVRKTNGKADSNNRGAQKSPATVTHKQVSQPPELPKNNAPKQPSKIQPGAGQPKQPVQKNTVPLDKVKQDIPNFSVSNKSDIDKITPEQQKNVSMKINDLAKAAADAKANGEKAPNFNLCDITIPGTNLYCGGNKGIERAKMPQFKGTPQPGSEADKMQKDKNGEVDTEDMFKKMLQDKGIKVSEPTAVPADQLKATQTELVGAKVAGMTKALEADPNHPGITAPIYVSSDGYVLDGHHRWAAVTSNEIASGRPANMNVRVIDMPIDKLVELSNQFAQDIGVQAKTADANKENDTESKTKKFKGTTSGKEIQTIEIDGGGQVYGTVHKNTAMVDDIINDVKSKIPKEKWKDIVFVGEGGATNKLGELEFHDEMKYAVPKFQEMGAGVDTFDGDELDVHKPDSKLYKKQIEKTGLNQSQVNAGNWASMIGQGEGTDTMKPTTFLDESGKQFLQDAAKEAGFPPIENWDNPTDKDKDTLYRLSFPEDNGDKETKINDIQVAFNEIRDESIIEKSKSLSAQGKIPITIAGEGHIDLVDKKIKKSTEKSSTGLAPTSSKEKDAKGAGIGKVTTKAVQNPEIVKRAIKSKIQKWSDKEKKFFRNGEHKANSPIRRSIGEAINSKIKSIVPAVKREMEHLGSEFKNAGEGIGNLFNGKPLDERHKAAFKSLGKTVALSALGVAIGGGIGHGASVFVKHLGGHMAEHLVAELVAGGIGKAAIFAGTEMEGDTDKHVEWFILHFAKQMKDGNIPADVWEMALQDYNNDKEDGKVHEDDWDKAEQQNEVLTEMSSTDIHFKNIMKHYKSNKYTKRINMYLFGRPNLKPSPNDVARALRNMGYKEITDMEKELNISDLEEDINVDVNKGDEVLMGKFKNKKVVVKDLGKDQHGMPTINGKQATTFRKVEENLNEKEEFIASFKGKNNYKSRVYTNGRKFYTMNYNELTGNHSNFEAPTYEKILNILHKHGYNVNKELSFKFEIINEGGAYGHMNHPFDIRMNLSFGDLKNIVNNALDGKLGVVREKTDGQALAISWKNGRLIAARNKGHLANAGANAMDINGVAGKFGGRGGLTDAYNFAMKDLENAIRGLSQAQKDKIFKNGKCFVNLEVIWPTSVNVIPYNQALLVFHNAVEYNDAGNAIAKVDGAESVLGGMIKQINAHVQSKYTIQGPPIVSLPKNKTLSSQKGKFNGMISKLQSEFGLTDKDGVADYHQAWWENFVDKSKKKIKPLEKSGLVKRWAFDDKSFRIADITDETARNWADGIDKGAKVTIMSGNLRKFEDIFLGVGAEVLSFMSSVLTAQPDKALRSMQKELETTANQIMNGGTITQIKKLEKELSRLNAIGGFEKIVPSEGIVFQYKGNAYKLTGAFAPLNQILGIFKFSR